MKIMESSPSAWKLLVEEMLKQKELNNLNKIYASHLKRAKLH